MWPTIQIAYKNGTIHMAYTSPLYRSTTVQSLMDKGWNATAQNIFLKKYPEHSPTMKNFFALKSKCQLMCYTHIFSPKLCFLSDSFNLYESNAGQLHFSLEKKGQCPHPPPTLSEDSHIQILHPPHA